MGATTTLAYMPVLSHCPNSGSAQPCACPVPPSQQRSAAAFPCVFSLKADRIARFLSSVDRPADFPMDDACWAAQILCSFFGLGTPIPPATGTPAFLLSSRVFVVALPPNVKPAQQPAPALHESNRLRFTGCMKRINVVPGLQRRSPLQVLMWPDFVEGKWGQIKIVRGNGGKWGQIKIVALPHVSRPCTSASQPRFFSRFKLHSCSRKPVMGVRRIS